LHAALPYPILLKEEEEGMKKYGTLAVFFLVFAACGVSAQSNEVLDRVLAEEQLTYGSAAYVLAVATGKASEESTPEQAVGMAEQGGFGLEGMGFRDGLNIGQYSYMLMRAFQLTGGMMYRILPGPRYAAREMDYAGVIQGPAIPGMAVSGNEALRMLERLLNRREASS
jgi:hypothetical protein